MRDRPGWGRLSPGDGVEKGGRRVFKQIYVQYVGIKETTLIPVMWIRNMDLDPELFVSEPDPGKNEEKTDKKSKYYFKFALIVQKICSGMLIKSDSS